MMGGLVLEVRSVSFRRQIDCALLRPRFPAPLGRRWKQAMKLEKFGPKPARRSVRTAGQGHLEVPVWVVFKLLIISGMNKNWGE